MSVRFPKPVSGRIDPKASSDRRGFQEQSEPRPERRRTGGSVKDSGKDSARGPARDPAGRRAKGPAKGPAKGFSRDEAPRPPKKRAPEKQSPEREAAGREEDDGFIPLISGAPRVLELLESAPERVDAVFLRKGRHGKEMERVADLCREAGVRFSLLEGEAFARACPGARGAAARIFQAGYVEAEKLLENIMEAPLPLVVALDQVQDPGNAGTLARTLYALGGAGLIVPRHNGVYLGAAAFKAAAGALAMLPVAKCANLGQTLDAAKKLGITVYGAATKAAGDIPVHDVSDFTPRLPAVLVLGGEENGMRPGVEKRCDALLRVPMLRAIDSLNVAQAGAIIVSRFVRRG